MTAKPKKTKPRRQKVASPDFGAYLPSRQDIEAGCALAQSRWTPRERLKRSSVHEPEAVETPVVKVTTLIAAALNRSSLGV